METLFAQVSSLCDRGQTRRLRMIDGTAHNLYYVAARGLDATATAEYFASRERGRVGQVTEIAIIVPVLNEEQYIRACLASLIPQAKAAGAEIILVDGGSTDSTRAIVYEEACSCTLLRLMDNPGRIQSIGVNLGARATSAALIMRADAHATYPGDFIRRCVDAYYAKEATSVVVPMRTIAQTGFQRAVAAAQNGRIGNGGAAHRRAGASGFVDHGHHALFERAFFLSISGYDESFTHNEDAEFDYRAVAAGGRIWLCAEAPVSYYPRRDPAQLARQYFRHGRGRARMLQKHRLWPRPRQVAPLFILGFVSTGCLLAPLAPICLAAPAAYAMLCVGWGMPDAVRARDPWKLATGVAAMIMHLSWAIGFLSVVWQRTGVGTAPKAGCGAGRFSGVTGDQVR